MAEAPPANSVKNLPEYTTHQRFFCQVPLYEPLSIRVWTHNLIQ